MSTEEQYLATIRAMGSTSLVTELNNGIVVVISRFSNGLKVSAEGNTFKTALKNLVKAIVSQVAATEAWWANEATRVKLLEDNLN